MAPFHSTSTLCWLLVLLSDWSYRESKGLHIYITFSSLLYDWQVKSSQHMYKYFDSVFPSAVHGTHALVNFFSNADGWLISYLVQIEISQPL